MFHAVTCGTVAICCVKPLHVFCCVQPHVLQRFMSAKLDHFVYADSIDHAVQLIEGKQSHLLILFDIL